MKKILTLTMFIFLTSCADTAILGYKKNIGVFYEQPPQNCQQIGMTILSYSYYTGNLEKEINELRDEAAKIGGNYVNISSYAYEASILRARAQHMTGTIYYCPTRNKFSKNNLS